MQTVRLKNIKKQGYTMKESLRSLKTNIQFCGDDNRVILITSSIPNEGKSTVSFELARCLTESGKKVLLIDTDMRKSVLVGRLRAVAEKGEIKGLSHYLSGMNKMEDVVYVTDIDRLFMVFAGPSVPNPTEILEKVYFKELIEFGRKFFDYVLVDCAPIGAAIDAAVVAKQCDGAVLVVGQGMSKARMIKGVLKQLEASGIRILGVVLNKVKMNKKGYGYGYHYGYGYGYGYGSAYGSYGNESEE